MATKLDAATAEAPVTETGANGASSPVRGLLTAADILAADDIGTEYIEVPEWGGTVKLTALTGEQRNKIGALMRAEGKRIGEDTAVAFFQMRIVAASMIDEAGKRLFNQSDVEKLAKKSGAALSRVYAACAKLSGLGDEEVEEAKEELKATPNDDIG